MPDDLEFIQHLAVLRIQQGDALVVRMPERPSREQVLRTTSEIRRLLELAGVYFLVPVLFLEKDQELGVLRAGGSTEREQAIAVLRRICEDFGDNDWPDDLHLADVIDKHLGDYLEERAGAGSAASDE